MKNKILAVLALASALLFSPHCFAADTNRIATDLNDLITRVNAKLMAGKITEADLAGELKEYDLLYAKHQGEKPQDVAEILLAKVSLYIQVLDEPDKAAEVIIQLKKDFPALQINGDTDATIAEFQKMAEAMTQLKKTLGALVLGAKFPDFEEKDLTGKPLSLSRYKGKVVLIDFWATWCPPCVREMPNTLKIYEKYHDQGFEIVGISLDGDQAQLEKFIKEENIAWPQFFDGKGWDNKLAVKYGAKAPPEFYLLDREGKIIGMDRYPDTVGALRGEVLEAAVAKALANK